MPLVVTRRVGEDLVLGGGSVIVRVLDLRRTEGEVVLAVEGPSGMTVARGPAADRFNPDPDLPPALLGD